jgi:hypothetical protein
MTLTIRFIEFGLLLAFVWLIGRHPDVAANLKLLPALQRTALKGFFLVTLLIHSFTLGQYQYPDNLAREWFPFTRWAMFSEAPGRLDSADIYEFEALTKEGESFYLNPAQLFPSMNVAQVTKIWVAGGNLKYASTDEQRLRYGAIMRHHMIGLKRRFQRQRPELDVAEVRLWCRKLPMSDGAAIPPMFEGPQSELLMSVSEH